MRNPSLAATLSLSACLLLAACTLESPDTATPTAPGDTVFLSDTALLGPWVQKLSKDTIYLGGSRLEFEFGRDSLEFRAHYWSDVVQCRIVDGNMDCSDAFPKDVNRGTWTLEDSILRIAYRHSPTARFPETDTADRHAEFKVVPNPDGTLYLAFLGSGTFLTGRQTFLLQRPEADSATP